MALASETLAAIQKAGQALHDAATEVNHSLKAHAAQVVASVASEPFDTKTDQSLAELKHLAKFSHELASLEQHLRTLYATASTLAHPAMEVISNGASKRKLFQLGVGTSTAQDVQTKDVPVPKGSGKGQRKTKGRKSRAASLTPNDEKLLRYLMGTLDAGALTTVTGSVMAAGSGLPLGSIGISLGKLIQQGAVVKGSRGAYRLP
jgi:hypothetical protein